MVPDGTGAPGEDDGEKGDKISPKESKDDEDEENLDFTKIKKKKKKPTFNLDELGGKLLSLIPLLPRHSTDLRFSFYLEIRQMLWKERMVETTRWRMTISTSTT